MVLRSLALVAITALSTGACATTGPPAPDLAYEEILGPWEMGDPDTGFVTGRVTFLASRQAQVLCGTVDPGRVSDPPRDVTRRGRGWAFRGCDGQVVVTRNANGEIEARSDVSRSRATVGRGCDRVEIDARGQRCAEYGDNISSVSRTENRLLGFWRAGAGGGPRVDR